MKNGFLIVWFTWLIDKMVWLNLDELLKKAGLYLPSNVVGQDDETLKTRRNAVIDCWIVAKWAFILLAFLNSWTGSFVFWLTWYLLAINTFGYFYHHAWGNGFERATDLVSQRRRFVNFLLAIGFYIICYAHLYMNYYACDIGWPEGSANKTDAIYLSVANAFTLTYGDFKALSQTARVVFMSELITTFIMLTIVLANSIPNQSEDD